MPPKKIKSAKESKQKKIVTSTLLTISLKVDNYIYKKEPIPLEKAKAYIEEIVKIKIECDDVRSRQVSEKLTSILKGVIEEYSNKVISTIEDSIAFPLNLNIGDKLNEQFETNEAAHIGTATDEALAATKSSAVNSQNDLIESINIGDQKYIPKNIITPIDNMSKDSQKEDVLVNRNKENNKNVSLLNGTSKMETPNKNVEPTIQSISKEIINKNTSKIRNNKSKANKKKSVCMKKNQSKIDIKCTNSIVISKEKVTKAARNKKTKSKNKQIVDLTWVENIKFFREINTDEHLVTKLEESFWSDLSMPANCSFDFETD